MISTSANLSDSIKCAVPVLIRCMEIDSGAEEYLAETVRVSPMWFLIKTPHALKLGGLLSLRLHVPTEVSGSPFSEVRGDGRVVSEHQLEDGTVGYKVAFDPSLDL
ncbi:MAG: hypothetical protein WBL63_23215 [Candidatus Acidiferrum sp.]